MTLQPAVKKETVHIACGVCVLGVITLGVFTLLGRFGLPVVWGLLLGAAAAILNFLFLGFTVQRAAEGKSDQGPAVIRLSYSVRTLLLGVYIFFALRCSWVNSAAAVLPLFFPRVTIAAMNFSGYGKVRQKT